MNLVLALFMIFPFPSKEKKPLDETFRDFSKIIVHEIAMDETIRKRVVVLSFTNDNLDTNTNERLLGIYLARLFTYFLLEEGNKKGIEVINRSIGEKVTLKKEMRFRKSFPAESLLALLESDYYITVVYHLYENELEVVELIASRSIGAKEVGRTKRKIEISDNDYKKMKVMENVIVPWKKIDPRLLSFLVKDGEWGEPINDIEILDFYTGKPISSDTLYLEQYIKISIKLDSLPTYLYVIAWDQELKRLSFLFPNKYDKINPITKRQVVIPFSDTLGFPIKGPIENKGFGDYNWLKVFVSKKPITSFPVTEGFLKETDARLKNIDLELDSLGVHNWSSVVVDFWVKER